MASSIVMIDSCISRPNRREWIETYSNPTTNTLDKRISRPNRREWIETGSSLATIRLPMVSPGLIAGSGLKLYF